jgi:hypothetical protein
LMNALRHVGLHYLLGFRAGYLPCRLAPHCGVLTTRLPLDQGAICAGRALERVWLTAQSAGLAFQPLVGSALLALPEYTDVPVHTGDRLRRGWRELTAETPMVVFRMGYAKRPSVRTSRRSLECYLVGD